MSFHNLIAEPKLNYMEHSKWKEKK